MWKLWKKSKSEADMEAAFVELRALESKVEAFKTGLVTLEARMNAIETDWATTFLKFRRMYGHLTKTLALDSEPVVKPPAKPNGEIDLETLTVEEILRRPTTG